MFLPNALNYTTSPSWCDVSTHTAPNHITFHGILQTYLICCPLSLDLSGITVFWIFPLLLLTSIACFFFPSKALGLYLSALILILCDPFSYFNLWNLEEHFTLFTWVFPGLLDLISTVNIISMLFTFFLAYEWTCLGKKKEKVIVDSQGPSQHLSYWDSPRKSS